MMRSLRTKLFATAILALPLAVGADVTSGGRASAQSAASSQSAQELLQAGQKAQSGRNHAAAISYFTRAINSGRLPRKQMTYALYRRAVSNRAQRQPAAAISDLNSALFFKGDLSSQDRANAIEERMRAFKDAGLAPTAIATASSASQWGATATSSVPVAQPNRRRVISTAPRRVLEPIQVVRAPTPTALPPGAPILAPAPTERQTGRAAVGDLSAFQTRVAARPVASARSVPQSRPIRQSPVESYLTPKVDRGVGVPRQPRGRQSVAKPVVPKASWQVATTSKQAPAVPSPSTRSSVPPFASPTVNVATVAPSKPEPVSTETSTTSGFGQFFSGLFGGSSTSSSPQTTASVKAPVATTEVKPEPAAVRPRPVAKRLPAAPAPRARKPVKVAAVQPVAAPPPKAPVTRARERGKFEIEVATLRSKERADALARQLMVQYPGGGFWSKKQEARVKQTADLGDDGAIYSVRYGVYDSKDDLSPMCEQFKADGLACEAVRQN